MSASFLTSLTEHEFKAFLKEAIKEVLHEDQKNVISGVQDTMDIEEAAAFIKLKISTIYEKTSKRLIPHFKKGNKLYFIKSELEDWIKKGKVATGLDIESSAATFLLNSKSKH